MNIMRADACRLMALWYYGGVYADLDVYLKNPVHKLACSGFCGGYELPKNALGRIGNYFLVSTKKRNRCLYRAIELCCINLKRETMDFTKNNHLVHDSCGPAAFTHAVTPCIDTLWEHRHMHRVIDHKHASLSWHDGYPSWVDERQQRAGWKTRYG